MVESFRSVEEYEKRQREGKIKADVFEYLDGLPLFSGISSKNVEHLRRNAMIKPDDVFIVTYPKSGTTWIQQILKLLDNNGVESMVYIDAFCPWSLEEISVLPSPHHFASHLPYSLMPGGGNPAATPAKYIYVYRNPKDVAVSFYHWMPAYFWHDEQKPWDEFLDAFINGKFSCGTFYSHILSWWSHRESSSILILTYEQMKRDPHSAVISIAKFLELHVSSDIIETVVKQTSFSSMKSTPTANWSADVTNLMHKGVIGDWKNMFTEEQSARIDTIVADKLAFTGLVFDYGDV